MTLIRAERVNQTVKLKAFKPKQRAERISMSITFHMTQLFDPLLIQICERRFNMEHWTFQELKSKTYMSLFLSQAFFFTLLLHNFPLSFWSIHIIETALKWNKYVHCCLSFFSESESIILLSGFYQFVLV